MVLRIEGTLAADILSKQEAVFNKADDIDVVSREINHNLRNRRKCSLAQANVFYDFYAAKVQNLALGEIREASQTYTNLVEVQYVPMYLVENLFQKFSACFQQSSDILDCIRKVSDLLIGN